VKPVSKAKSGLLGLAAVLSLTISQSAYGQKPGTFTLSWQGPAGCPSRDELYVEIARLLGGDIRVPQDGTLKARSLVTHQQTWAVTIETELAGRAGHRFIEAASCQDLANATALIIALMIDPDAVAAHATEPGLIAATSATVATPRKEPSPIEVLLGIHTAFSHGTLPSLDAGLGAGVGLAGRYWRLELRGTYGLRRDQKAAVSTPPGAYGQFNFVAGALVGCFNLGHASLGYGPCADAELGVVSAKGFGVNVSLPAHTLWWALGAGLYGSMPLGHHLSLPLHADVLAPLRRTEFVFKDNTGRVTSRVFQAPPAGVRISAGVELSF
jgi:hypothetical protein